MGPLFRGNPATNCQELSFRERSYCECSAGTRGGYTWDRARDEKIPKVITGSSSLRMVRKEVRRRDRGVIKSVHVRYDEVYCLYTMGVVVDKLAELRGEEENVVRFVTVEIPRKRNLARNFVLFGIISQEWLNN